MPVHLKSPGHDINLLLAAVCLDFVKVLLIESLTSFSTLGTNKSSAPYCTRLRERVHLSATTPPKEHPSGHGSFLSFLGFTNLIAMASNLRAMASNLIASSY